MNPVPDSSTIKARLKPTRSGKNKRNGALGSKYVEVAETPSEYSFAIAKTSVAQICQSVGYKRSTYGALETLTNVATKYLEAIARSAASFANSSHRTDSNFFDLVNGIHDLSSVQGFPGCSNVHKSNLLRSGTLKEIMNFANHSNEVPFAKSIPSNNVSGSPNIQPTTDSASSMFCSKKAEMHGLHIPRWLPDFPAERLPKNSDKDLVNERKCGQKLWEHSPAAAVDNCGGKVEENTGELLQNRWG